MPLADLLRQSLYSHLAGYQDVNDARGSFQLCVFRLGFLQDGDVGVGVFPEREEIFAGGERPDANP